VIVKILEEERGTSFNPHLVKNFLGLVQNNQPIQPGPTA
jgi:response regulator RpfG family c-di-GMP phosphodiesterase